MESPSAPAGKSHLASIRDGRGRFELQDGFATTVPALNVGGTTRDGAAWLWEKKKGKEKWIGHQGIDASCSRRKRAAPREQS